MSFRRPFALTVFGVIVFTISFKTYILPSDRKKISLEHDTVSSLKQKEEETLLKTFKSRRIHIENTCKQFFSKTSTNMTELPEILIYNSNDTRLSQTVKLTSHLVYKKRNVTYCWLHKVASSSWMRRFLWIKNGRKPSSNAKPYLTQFSMKPESMKMFQTTVENYMNIILGKIKSVKTFSRNAIHFGSMI